MAASPSHDVTEMRLDAEAIAAVDHSDMLADIVGLPEHLRDALWKVESANLQPWDCPGGLVVAGMGGSAVGGALARAMLGDHASRPVLASRQYGLPAWTTPDTTDPVRLLLGQHRGDARLLRGGRARSARRAWRSRAAASWPSSRAPTACR